MISKQFPKVLESGLRGVFNGKWIPLGFGRGLVKVDFKGVPLAVDVVW